MIKHSQLTLSPYTELYNLIVPKDNMLRQINEMVDFSFVYEELATNYCLDNGRGAIDPVRMFKYLLLKSIFELLAVDVVERSKDDVEALNQSKDSDAKVGHKTADTAFFGYKTHIAMTEKRIITAVTVTSGGKHDGKQLKDLIEKSKQAGLCVKDVIGDATYSEKENIEYTKSQEINLVAKLSKSVIHGNRLNENNFEYNKDAEMYVCKEGHMAFKKARQGKKNVGTNQAMTYYFDVEKCKRCSQKEGCYKEGAKSKTYSVTIKSKERYKIEAKNSELKIVS